MRPSFAVAAFLLTVSTALVSLPAHAGAPLKGVDVKLGKTPGGGAQARTDAGGHFTFPVLPKGSYELSIGQHVETVHSARTPPQVAVPPCDIEIRGAEGGTMALSWDGGKFHTPARANTKAAVVSKVLVTSDGTHPIAGMIATPTAR